MTKYKYFGKLIREACKYSYIRRRTLGSWLKTMNANELDWCIKHNFIKKSEPIECFCESPNIKYYELTKLGNRLYDWYVYDTWTYIKHIMSKIFKF